MQDGPVVLITLLGTPYNATCVAQMVLLAKIDGAQATWAFNSALWNSSETLNLDNGDLNQTEAKLDAFNLFQVSSLRVGFASISAYHDFNSTIIWLDLPLNSTFTSLKSAFQSYAGISTRAGQASWSSLLADLGSTPAFGVTVGRLDCNLEGLNMRLEDYPYYITRLGIACLSGTSGGGVGNDMVIGFGNRGNADGAWDWGPATVGFTRAGLGPFPVFGYILGS